MDTNRISNRNEYRNWNILVGTWSPCQRNGGKMLSAVSIVAWDNQIYFPTFNHGKIIEWTTKQAASINTPGREKEKKRKKREKINNCFRELLNATAQCDPLKFNCHFVEIQLSLNVSADWQPITTQLSAKSTADVDEQLKSKTKLKLFKMEHWNGANSNCGQTSEKNKQQKKRL